MSLILKMDGTPDSVNTIPIAKSLHATWVLQNTGDRIAPINIGNSIQLLYFGRSKSKVTAKRATGILMPVLRKAPNVSGYLMGHTLLLSKDGFTS